MTADDAEPDDLPERWGALVVRVWVDDSKHPSAIRAHVSQSLDIAQDERSMGLATNVDEVTRTVREWVEDFVRSGVTIR